MYVNQFDAGEKCAKHGYATEDTFEKLAVQNGYGVRHATKEEQIQHIDFILDSPKWHNIKVDVKARKKTSRKNKEFNDKWVWIEFRNVQGNDGWIYGKSNFIAFERREDFVIVNRVTLRNWLGKSNVRWDMPPVKNSWEAKYRIYSRRGRRDQLTQVKMSDILKLPKIKEVEEYNRFTNKWENRTVKAMEHCEIPEMSADDGQVYFNHAPTDTA
jgi:hypothetical protein